MIGKPTAMDLLEAELTKDLNWNWVCGAGRTQRLLLRPIPKGTLRRVDLERGIPRARLRAMLGA